jgi:hypothetical protein
MIEENMAKKAAANERPTSNAQLPTSNVESAEIEFEVM